MAEDQPANRGRPSTYTDEIAMAICERISEGESLRSITSDDDMPHQRTVYRWLLVHDDFRQQYARARELQADTLADETLDIADDARNDWMKRQDSDGQITYQLNGENIQRSRLRIDQRKWMAGKLKPKVYGDKIDHTLAGDKDRPVQIEAIKRVIVRSGDTNGGGV